MSHWEKATAQVKDLGCLKAAGEELGATVLIDDFARGWAGQTRKCEMVIRIPNGKYDIAVTKDGEEYKLEADFYDGSVEKFFGTKVDGAVHKLGKLIGYYSAHCAEAICRKQRKPFSRVLTERGIEIHVKA